MSCRDNYPCQEIPVEYSLVIFRHPLCASAVGVGPRGMRETLKRCINHTEPLLALHAGRRNIGTGGAPKAAHLAAVAAMTIVAVELASAVLTCASPSVLRASPPFSYLLPLCFSIHPLEGQHAPGLRRPIPRMLHGRYAHICGVCHVGTACVRATYHIYDRTCRYGGLAAVLDGTMKILNAQSRCQLLFSLTISSPGRKTTLGSTCRWGHILTWN